VVALNPLWLPFGVMIKAIKSIIFYRSHAEQKCHWRRGGQPQGIAPTPAPYEKSRFVGAILYGCPLNLMALTRGKGMHASTLCVEKL